MCFLVTNDIRPTVDARCSNARTTSRLDGWLYTGDHIFKDFSDRIEFSSINERIGTGV